MKFVWSEETGRIINKVNKISNLMFFEKSDQPRTDGSVGWASGCHTGGREFDSGQTSGS
mgnify:CR=1 FL=1